MPYIDLAGLSRYASRQKDRLERDYALLRDMQWTRSEKAGAVSLWPVGGTPLDVSVDFLFTETPPAEGDKSPSNPSTIAGVENVVIFKSGKNLLPSPYTYSTRTINDVKFTVNDDGSVLANGTSTARTVFFLNATPQRIIFYPGINYIMHGRTTNVNGNNVAIGIDLFSFEENPVYKRTVSLGDDSSVSFTVDTKMYGRQYIAIANGVTVQNELFYFQIEISTTKTSYEKPIYNSYILSLNGTYYGGTLDVASGVMTVTHRSEQLTSVRSLQSVNTNTVCFRLNTTASFVPENPTVQLTTASNRFTYSSAIGDFEYFRVVGAFGGSSKLIEISINKTRLDVSMAIDPSNPTGAEWETAFASWLESNPTFFVGKLFTPFTVTLTPTEILSLTQTDKYTPRLNTVYTDAQAVQVGYVKSPIRDEYELTQAITAQGGNV